MVCEWASNNLKSDVVNFFLESRYTNQWLVVFGRGAERVKGGRSLKCCCDMYAGDPNRSLAVPYVCNEMPNLKLGNFCGVIFSKLKLNFFFSTQFTVRTVY